MKLNIKNETGRLKSVVLGQPQSMGSVPSLEESYDAKSYDTIQKGIYPKEEDIVHEMNEFEKILKVRSGANKGLTLLEARENYKQFSACERDMIRNVRPPNNDKKPQILPDKF